MCLKRRGQERGAAAVEMALITPLLILLIFAIIDFGRYFFVDISVNAAAHEAARVGSLYPVSGAKMQAVAAGTAPFAAGMANVLGGTSTLTVKVAVCPQDATGATCVPAAVNTSSTYCVSGSAIKVRVSTQFHWILQVPGLTDHEVAADGVMVCTV